MKRAAALLILAGISTPALAGDTPSGDAYPLATCPVSGGKLGGRRY